MEETCRHIGTYEGVHKPKCNDGLGCKACWRVYAEKQAIKADGGRTVYTPLRPAVMRFAALMEEQLRANDHKPGWDLDTAPPLLHKAGCHMDICTEEMPYLEDDPTVAAEFREIIMKHAIHAANYLMMMEEQLERFSEHKSEVIPQ